MSNGVLVVLTLSLILFAAFGNASAAPSDSVRPAEWSRQDMIIKLQSLPKRYSCNDLWYRFRDILIDIGARPNMNILTYRCEGALGPNARSPRVHLTFDIPRAVRGEQSGTSALQVTATTVHLAAGQPRSLDGADCALLRQIKDTLFAALSVRVVDFNLDCAASNDEHHPFGVSVRALLPAPGEPHLAISPIVLQPFS